MACVIAFIKVFAVFVPLVLAVAVVADFLYKRFSNKTQYIEKEGFVSILRLIVVNRSSDRMVAGDGGYYTSWENIMIWLKVLFLFSLLALIFVFFTYTPKRDMVDIVK